MKELDPLIGLTVSGRYRVHTLIGQGGMGKVFQAQQIPLGRAVALKVLEANRVDAGFHRRFFQEAAILAKLKSRHTVTIYDYGRDGDVYFIAMELVGGSTLAQVLAGGPVPIERSLSIAEQICRSLREAHGQGVIHRDLKPGNVIVSQSEDGEELVKVLDFGLAKRLDRDSVADNMREDTDSDTVPGSPKYMAPEVIRQQPIDGRADIYGLGVMLYQMLCGVVPFDRESAADILMAHLHEAPKPLRQVRPDLGLPESVEQLVMRCIEKSPAARFPDVQSLLDALRAASSELRSGYVPKSSRPPQTDPAPSGVRKSGASPSLRLKAEDRVGPAARTGTAAGLPRVALIAGGVCVLAAGAIYAAASSGTEPAAPPLPPASAAPAAKPAEAAPSANTPIENAKVAAQAEGAADAPQQPDMVFTPESVAAKELPKVKLRVRSEPPGAMVILRGTRMGATPLSFDWRSIHARQGKELALVLQLEGYEPYTIRRPIDAAELELSAKLVPISDEPAADESGDDDPGLPELEPPPEPPALQPRPKLAVPENEATVPEP